MKKHYLSVAFLLASLVSSISNAQDFTALSGELVVETQLEEGINSDAANNERTRLFARSELAAALQLNENFYLDGVAVLEPLFDGHAVENRFFDDEGVFIEELKLNYEHGAWGAFVGKFNPAFGIAWDYGRGIWTEDFAEDYEITEKLGLGASYQFDVPKLASHQLTFSTFYADTTFLSRSIVKDRPRVRRADSGASNTGDFSSFVLSLDGEQVAGIEGLSYHLAYRYLAKGVSDIDDEQGVAAFINYQLPVSDALHSDILVEFASIQNFEGLANDVRYFTANAVNKIYRDWDVTIGYTERLIDTPAGANMNDYLFQLTGGYDFQNGLTLEAGWRKSKESNVTTDILGGLARYTVEF